MVLAATIDVKDVLRNADQFGWEQADKVRRALCNSQYAELKQEYQVLRQTSGTDSPSYYLRVGIVAYLLGMLQEAEQALSHKSLQNDGTALFYHGHVLTSLERHAESEQKYLAAEAGWDTIDCKLAGLERSVHSTVSTKLRNSYRVPPRKVQLVTIPSNWAAFFPIVATPTEP